MKCLSFLVLSVSALLLLPSCAPSEDRVTPAEATQLARHIDSSLREKDADPLRDVIDEELLARAAASAGGQRYNASLRKGIEESLRKNGFSQQVSTLVEGGGTYRLVRTYEKEGRQHMIFRLFSAAGLNYHDFELTKRKERVRARDVYILLSGEKLSATMAGLLKSLDGQSDGSAQTQAAQMKKIQDLYRREKYQPALEEIRRLPASLRNNRTFRIMELTISSHLDSATYAQSLQSFETSYGNDPSAQFALFDHYFTRKDYPRVHRIINEIDKMMEDPWLNYYRGLTYREQGDTVASLKAFERLMQHSPDFEDGALELISMHVQADDVERGNKAIAEYKKHKEFNQTYLTYIRYKYEQALHFNW
ncbi:MAG: hypothetical protein EOO08_12780 [Chitinophagaceae bacterium]|nr:MAG: hypothetical protein EOO08_12780 [Chitinophagaceae bacterium]